MAVTTDLATVLDFDGTNPSSYTLEFTNYTAGSKGAVDTDFPIQSTNHASQECRTAAAASMALNPSAGSTTYVTDGHIFGWAMFLAPAAVDSYANGGIMLMVGSATSAWKGWYVGGNDYGRYPFGGWQCLVARDTFSTDETAGTASATTFSHVGFGFNIISAIAKGSPIGIDAIRYGLGELRVNGTETFTSMESTANSSTNRWGLFQEIGGSYLWKGQMVLGYSSALTMTDSNKNIVVEDVRKVNSNFNRIEVNNAGTALDWTAINISSLGTVSLGSFEAIDNATIDKTTCVFTDMSTFIYQSNSTLVDTTYRRCALITTGGATFTGCTFDEPTGAVGVTASSPANAALISTSDFISDGTGNGLEITGTAANMTLTGVDFTGYSTTVDANKAIYVNIASGSMTLSISGGSGVTLDSHVRTAGCVVTVAADPVDVQVTTKETDGDAIGSALVFLKASDGTGPFPFEDAITIARSGTTATVTHTTHGMASNDYVVIRNAADENFNIVAQIAVSDASTYTYTVTDTGATTDTSSDATFVALYGTTHATTGILSTSRVYSSNQPVTGWSRKSSGSPYYKEGIINGIVYSASGLSVSAVMGLDE